MGITEEIFRQQVATKYPSPYSNVFVLTALLYHHLVVLPLLSGVNFNPDYSIGFPANFYLGFTESGWMERSHFYAWFTNHLLRIYLQSAHLFFCQMNVVHTLITMLFSFVMIIIYCSFVGHFIGCSTTSKQKMLVTVYSAFLKFIMMPQVFA